MQLKLIGIMAAIAALGGLATCAVMREDVTPLGESADLKCSATPVSEIGVRAGELTLVYGAQLTSDAELFGGISGIEVNQQSIDMITDQGHWISAEVKTNLSQPIGDISCVIAQDIVDPVGPVPGSKQRADAEGLAQSPGAQLIISFERDHRVIAYRRQAGSTEDSIRRQAGTPMPPLSFQGQSVLTDNGGLEALTVLKSGALLAGGEKPSLDGAHPVWRFEPSPDATKPFADTDDPSFAVTTPGFGFGLTGFDTTSTGALLVLYRQYIPMRGVTAVIGYVPAEEIETAGQGAVITPRELARLEPDGPIPTDNFEGIAAAAGSDGGTLIWIVSDDNFNDDQRTLLYAFSFDEPVFVETIAP